jgi:hypothetical protein
VPIQTRLHLFCSILAALIAACSPAPDALGPLPGHSDRPRGGPLVPATTAPDAGPVQWERWSELSAYRVAIARAPSQHLAADHEGETLANDSATAYPDLGPARLLPAGAVLVQRLYATGSNVPEVVLAMEKQPGDAAWEFLVLDASGLVTERGALETCGRCHAEAPHDSVFGKAQ